MYTPFIIGSDRATRRYNMKAPRSRKKEALDTIR